MIWYGPKSEKADRCT